MKFLRIASLILSLAALLTVTVAPAGANHSWNNYHWARTSNPFTISLGDNVSSTWDSHLGTSSSDWSKSTVLDTRVVAGGSSPSSCPPTSGKVEVCNYSYGANGWLGLATIWLSGGHIYQGTAQMNDYYFNQPTYNDPNARLHVMCQEVGHTFGLGHVKGPNNKSCMNDQFGLKDPAFARPNSHDYAQLESIYAHLDSSNSSSGASASTAYSTSEIRLIDAHGNGVVYFIVWISSLDVH